MKFAEPQLNPITFTSLFMLAIVFANSHSAAQNMYKDYVMDRNAQYSPFDYQQRGLIYQIQTGHAGLFGHCDGDRQKMASPYVDWHCRSSTRHPAGQFSWSIVTDLFQKKERMMDGAGACAWGMCARCGREGSHCYCDGSPENIPHPNNQPVPTAGKRPEPLGAETIQPRQRYRQVKGNVVDPYVSPTSSSPASPFPKSSRSYLARPVAYSAKQMSNLKHDPAEQRYSRNSRTGDSEAEITRASVDPGRMSDPRYSTHRKPVPANRFERYEKQPSPQRSRRNIAFGLSGGQVFSRSGSSSAKPVADPPTSPQYFQFQQIGESANR